MAPRMTDFGREQPPCSAAEETHIQTLRLPCPLSNSRHLFMSRKTLVRMGHRSVLQHEHGLE